MFSIFKLNSQDIFFGSYKKPDLLIKLEDYQKKEKLSWECLGFFIVYDHHYSVTPLDVIPFSATGGAGTHFGFLTDFNYITDLNNAPILCVSPTDDPPLKLVAKNLTDFLRLIVTIGDAEMLYEDFDSDDQIETRIQERNELPKLDWEGNPLSKDEISQMEQTAVKIQQVKTQLIKVLKDEFQILPMASASQYLNDIRADRQTEIAIRTSDDIGIRFPTQNLSLNEFDYNIKDSTQIMNYLNKASQAERLKFYRDATIQYILTKDYDNNIRKIILESLRKNGYSREFRILEKKY